jgi:hypothetical protein
VTVSYTSGALRIAHGPGTLAVIIKECQSTDRGGSSSNSLGRISLSCWPMWRLLIGAYQLYADGKVDPLNPALPRLPMDGGPYNARHGRGEADWLRARKREAGIWD